MLTPARTASAAKLDPGTAAPIGVKASDPTPPIRSAMVSTAMNDRSSTAPWRNSAGPSMTTEPFTPLAPDRPAVWVWWFTATRTTARKPPTRATSVSATWTE